MKSFVIAEIASNWEGSVTKATKLIHEIKKAGADAVKFQMWRANDLYNDTHPSWKFIKKSELTVEKIGKLNINITSIVTIIKNKSTKITHVANTYGYVLFNI